MHLLVLEEVTDKVSFPQVMKTYHMYHAESISAESKLKEAEKQEEKQFNKAGDISVNLLRHEDRPQRRSSVKKIEKMKEKVGEWEPGMGSPHSGLPLQWGEFGSGPFHCTEQHSSFSKSSWMLESPKLFNSCVNF